METNKRRKWLTLLISFIFISVFFVTINKMKTQLEVQESDRLANALKSAAINCYAMEGAYPDSAEYLIEHYGIIIDENKYHVFYEVFASNIMPDIRVSRKG